MKRRVLWALTLALTAWGLAANDPMMLIFPLWLGVFLWQNPLRRLVSRFTGTSGFWVSGVFFGLLIEALAVWNNLDTPQEARVLLDPDPLRDLWIGVFYYGFLMAVWWWLLTRVAFSGRQVFVISGLFGILTEEVGGVLLRIFTQPWIGVPYALLVAVVYGVFPYLAWLLAGDRFPPNRPRAGLKWGVAALLALLVEWAVFGNTVSRWL